MGFKLQGLGLGFRLFLICILKGAWNVAQNAYKGPMPRDVDGWVPTSLPVQKFALTPAAAKCPDQIFCGIASYSDCLPGCSALRRVTHAHHHVSEATLHKVRA